MVAHAFLLQSSKNANRTRYSYSYSLSLFPILPFTNPIRTPNPNNFHRSIFIDRCRNHDYNTPNPHPPTYFLAAPKFVLAFLFPVGSLDSFSLSSPPAIFLFFLPFPEVADVGVGWFEALSPFPFWKLVDSGVGAIAATGVEAPDGTGESYFGYPISLRPNPFPIVPGSPTSAII